MATRYLVKAKNPTYEGKTFGVRFHEGKAVVDEHSISKHLGRSVKEIVTLMQADFGLTVEPLDETLEPKEEAPKTELRSKAPAVKKGKTELRSKEEAADD